MQLTGAQILVRELIRQGATTVFGYPGGAVLDIYDELYKNSGEIRHIITAHEQGAAHAADGYARVTGKPGVVIATSGPGATNLVTGIANAYLDSVPMVAITGNVAVGMLGKDSFQEVDIIGITQPVVKHNFIVRDINELQSVIAEAFRLASSGRRGPVLIDIPKSVQKDTCEYREDITAPEPRRRISRRAWRGLEAAIEAVEKSCRPYIYCGGGVVSADAGEEVIALSEKLTAPIGLSMMGLSAIPNSYPLNLGMSGMHGKYTSTIAQSRCDLMIAVGTRFSDRATGKIAEYTKNRTVIHIDIDEAELGKNVPNIIEVCGDAKAILSEIISRVSAKRSEEWLGQFLPLHERDKINPAPDSFTPRNIIERINSFASPETVVATDVGQHQMWVMQHYAFEKPGTLLTSGGLGTMGYGLGAAIGGCVASGGRRTVLFTGDGSFGMNLNELATAVSGRLPILIVLLNNGVLGMVRQWQNMFYESRYSSTTLERKTDFVALARAFGGDGAVVGTLSELDAILASRLSEDGPFLLDCRIDMDAKVYPMIPPGGSVKDIKTGKEDKK